jgi:hypothetical protein
MPAAARALAKPRMQAVLAYKIPGQWGHQVAIPHNPIGPRLGTVSIADAKARLSELVERAAGGETA